MIQLYNENNESKHIVNINGHCYTCDCQNKKVPFSNYNYLQSMNNNKFTLCLNCKCKICIKRLKNLLIKYKFMKYINPKRYYFNLWHKKINKA